MSSSESSRHQPDADWMRYAQDEQLLAQLGYELMRQDPSGELVVTGALAMAAIAAWERDEAGPIDTETAEARRMREAAGTFALIGLSLKEQGVRVADGTYTVRLQPAYVDAALLAARGTSN